MQTYNHAPGVMYLFFGWFISDVLHLPKEADWSNCLNFSKNNN